MVVGVLAGALLVGGPAYALSNTGDGDAEDRAEMSQMMTDSDLRADMKSMMSDRDQRPTWTSAA